MSDLDGWQPSLFSSTSAFAQESPEPPPPAELVQPAASTLTAVFSEIVTLLEDALAGITDDEVLAPLREALEIARDHA